MTDTPPPPPEPDEPARRTATAPPRVATVFRRSSDDRVLGGLVAAISVRVGVDVVVGRVITVVLAFLTGGLVVALYLLGWLLVARDDDPAPRVYEHVAVRDGGVLTWIAAVVLALAVFDAALDPFSNTPSFGLLPLVLIGIGVALWTRGDTRGGTGGAPAARSSTSTWRREGDELAATAHAPPPPGHDPGPAFGQTTPLPRRATTHDPTQERTTVPTQTTELPPAAAGDAGWPPTGGRPVPTPAVPPTRPAPRERSVLGPVTVAAALIAAGIAAALDASPSVALDLGATGVMSVALLVIGLGLLVGTLWGRARWLLAVALLLMPFIGLGLVVRSAEETLGIDLDAGSGVGQRLVTIQGDEELPATLDLIAGQIEVRLSRWDPSAATLATIDGDGPDLEVTVGAGEVHIDMPSDVAWRVTTELGLGEYEVRGDGVDIQTSVEDLGTFPPRDDDFGAEFVREGGPDGGPVLDVSVDVGVGHVIIHEFPTTGDTTDPTTDDTTDPQELS